MKVVELFHENIFRKWLVICNLTSQLNGELVRARVVEESSQNSHQVGLRETTKWRVLRKDYPVKA